MDKNWTREFKDKMQDYQEIAPDGLWSDISSVMNIEPAKKPVLPMFIKYFGIIAAAAMVFGVIFFWNGYNIENDTYISDNQGVDSNYIDISNSEDINLVPTEKVIYADISPTKRILSQKRADTASFSTKRSNIPNVANQAAKSVLDTNTDISEDKPREETDKPTIINKHSEHSESTNNDNLYTFDELDDDYKPKARKIKIGASVSGAVGNSSSQKGYITTVNSAKIIEFGTNPENEIRMFNRNKDVNSNTKYTQPIKVGINLKGYISKRWSIGTGLEWTWLRSSLREGSSSYYSNSTKDMHYIGIPLNVNFDIWQGRTLNIYAFGGGTMEKCIYGKNSVQYVFNHSIAKNDVERFNEKQLQWSVSAGVGIEYNFSKFAGIYASPGISWHFDNGSNIDNIYKSRPFNFSLSIGFRFYL